MTRGEREGGRSRVTRVLEEAPETASISASQRGRSTRVDCLRVWPGLLSR